MSEESPRLVRDPTSYGGELISYYGDPPHEVRIGRYTSIADGVELMVGGNHRPDWVSTYPFRIRFGEPDAFADGHPASRGPISIGSDVWIGRKATILSGVSIGDGAVIGARAVVAQDVRPYAVVVGNPAREVRRRFSDEHVEALLELRWWDWPEDEIHRIIPLLNGGSVEMLIAYARARGQV